MNFAGLKEYQTGVGRPLEKIYKSIMKDIVEFHTHEQSEYDKYEEIRELFPGMKQTFPNFLPNMTENQVKSLSNVEIDIILNRLTKYNF